jgi:hypothetical protein
VVALLLLIIAILAMKLRTKKQEGETNRASVLQYTGQEKQRGFTHALGILPAELHGEKVPAEMGESCVTELPADSRP